MPIDRVREALQRPRGQRDPCADELPIERHPVRLAQLEQVLVRDGLVLDQPVEERDFLRIGRTRIARTTHAFLAPPAHDNSQRQRVHADVLHGHLLVCRDPLPVAGVDTECLHNSRVRLILGLAVEPLPLGAHAHAHVHVFPARPACALHRVSI